LIFSGSSQSESHGEVKEAFFCPKKALGAAFCGNLGRKKRVWTAGAYPLDQAVFYFLRGCCEKK